MLYAEFISIIALLASSMGNVFTMLDTVVIFVSPLDYSFTLLDMLLGALISEELLSIVMEF